MHFRLRSLIERSTIERLKKMFYGRAEGLDCYVNGCSNVREGKELMPCGYKVRQRRCHAVARSQAASPRNYVRRTI